MHIENFNQLNPDATYTYADYLTWRFSEYVELIKGKIWLRPPSPSMLHQRIVSRLNTAFGNHLIGKKSEVFPAPFDVRLPRKDKATNQDIITVVQPDVCVICDKSKLDAAGCVGAPDLVVEVLSPGNTKKEMKNKFEIYEEAGVPEYWVVHPIERTIHIYVLNAEGQYYGLKPLTDEDEAHSKVLPGLVVSMEKLFEE